MKARLDDKVDRLRSQTMQFTSDGIQVTLNVPDTNDVKETFGTVITTVVEQQEEIEEITHNIDIIVDDTDKNQQDILLWTRQLLKEVKNDNMKLKKSLEASTYQLKNLSYNIQGYLDTEIDDSSTDIMGNVEISLPKLKKFKEKEAALFSTEAGAIVTSATLGFTPDTVNNNDSMMTITSLTNKPQKKLKTIEEKQQAKEYYHSISSNIFPNTYKQRWKWLIKKIITNIRLKKLKLGFTQQRLEPKQTFASKIDRLHSDLYEQKIALTLKIEKESEIQKKLLNESIEKVELKITNVETNMNELAIKTDNHFTIVHEEIHQMNENMIAFFTKLQEKADSETKELKDSLSFIQNHLKNILNIDYIYLISNTNHIHSNINHIDVTSDELYQNLQKVQVLISTLNPMNLSNPSLFTSTNPIQDLKELTELLQIDMKLRKSRSELNVLDRTLQSIKKDFIIFNDYITKKYDYGMKLYDIQQNKKTNKQGEDEKDIEIITEIQLKELAKITNDFKEVVPNQLERLQDMISAMYKICYDHDHQLHERYEVFSIVSDKLNHLLRVTSNIDDVKDRLDYLQTIVKDNEKEQNETFLAYDEHLIELTSRLGLMESLILDVEEKMEHKQDEIMKTIEEKSIERERMLKEEQEKYLATRNVVKKFRKTSFSHESTVETIPIAMNDPISTQPQEEKQQEPLDKVIGIKDDIHEEHHHHHHHEVIHHTTTHHIIDNEVNNNDDIKSNIQIDHTPTLPAIATTTNDDINKDIDNEDNNVMDGLSELNTLIIPPTASPRSKPPPYLSRERSIKLKSSFSNAIALESLESKLKPMFNQMILEKLTSQMISASKDGISNDQNKDNAIISRSNDTSKKDSTKQSNNQHTSEELELLTKELKKENNKLLKQIEVLKADKVDKKDMEEIFLQFYQHQKLLENGSDQAQAIADIEKRNQEIVREMLVLRHDHNHEIIQLKNNFSLTMQDVIHNTANKMEEENKDAFLNTRAFCLSCGRDGRVQRQPEGLSQVDSFFPQLNRPITPGPDIYRAGFRSPVKNNADFHSILEAGSSSILNSPTRRIKSAGQHMLNSLFESSHNSSHPLRLDDNNNNNHNHSSISQSSIINRSQSRHSTPGITTTKLPIVTDECDSSQNTHFDPKNHEVVNDYQFLFASDSLLEPTMDDNLQDDINENNKNHPSSSALIDNSNNSNSKLNMNLVENSSMTESKNGVQLDIASTTVPVRATSAMKTVRYGQGRPEAEELRSIYRKGLPGKKSLRAEVMYAPERYDLSTIDTTSLILKNNSLSLNQRRPNSSINDQDPKKHLIKNVLRVNINNGSTMMNSESLPRIL